MERSRDADHIVLKDHAGSGPLTAAILRREVRTLCTIRDIEGALASWMDTFGFDFHAAIVHLTEWFAMYRKIQPFCMTIAFEVIENDPVGAARTVARYLETPYPATFVDTISRRYSKDNVRKLVQDIELGREGVRDIGFSYYSEETFFHRRHVSSSTRRNPQQYFSSEQLRQIAKQFANDRSLLESTKTP